MSSNALNHYQRRDSLTRQTITCYQHLSGFRIDVMPREGFGQKYAAITLPFGAINTKFFDPEKGEEVHLPLGTLNFLMQIIFSSLEENSIAMRLAKIGVSGKLNIHSDYVEYSISTTEYFDTAVEIILEGLFEVDFSSEIIELTRKNILTSLENLADDSETYMSRNIRQSFYDTEEFFEPVQGNIASVKSITRADLIKCYRNLLHPGNLALILAGSFSERILLQKIVDILNMVSKEHSKETKIIHFPLLNKPVIHMKELSWEHPMSSFTLAYRSDMEKFRLGLGGKEDIQLHIESKILLDTLIGPGSEHFNDFRSTGLLGGNLDYKIYANSEYIFLEIKGISAQPQLTADCIAAHLEDDISSRNLSPDSFKARWTAYVGNFIRSMDSIVNYGRAGSIARANYIDFADYSTIFKETGKKIPEILDKFSFINAKNRAVLICTAQ